MNLGHFLLGAILYIFCFLLIVASITMYQLYQEDYQYKQTYKEFIKDFINDTKREFKKFTLFGKIVTFVSYFFFYKTHKKGLAFSKSTFIMTNV